MILFYFSVCSIFFRITKLCITSRFSLEFPVIPSSKSRGKSSLTNRYNYLYHPNTGLLYMDISALPTRFVVLMYCTHVRSSADDESVIVFNPVSNNAS